jgi:hypothetical protein
VIIFGVDPGKTTGLAWLEFPCNDHVPEARQLEAMSAVAEVERRLTALKGVEVVVACESFVPRPGVRSWQPDALEVIGALRYLCAKHDVEFLTQSPADAKSFSTNAKLDRLGWRKHSDHKDDAVRHLLLAAVKYGQIGKELVSE